MLSPHVQANAQMYNYHQANSRQPPPPQRQAHAPTAMGYYNNSNGLHAVSAASAAANGCMNAELTHRQSMERMSSISHPSEQFNHIQTATPPVPSNNLVTTQSQYYQPVTGGGGAMAAPNSCQHASDKVVNTHRPHSKSCSENVTFNVAMPSSTPQSSLQSQVSTKTDHPADITNNNSMLSKDSSIRGVPSQIGTLLRDNVQLPAEVAPLRDSKSPAKSEELVAEDELKPKEAAAVDSGIDSEQVDKDNDEEPDTSTTSNRSENSPQPSKKSCDLATDFVAENEDTPSQGGSGHPHHSDSDSGRVEDVFSPASSHEQPTSLSPATVATVDPVETISGNKSPETTDNEQKEPQESIPTDEVAPSSLNDTLEETELNDSFRSESSYDTVANSLASSNFSKKSLTDESRLPPRKRKHHLSEHTESLAVAMPLKKRGRPSKETIRLREAAKQAESTKTTASSPEATSNAVTAVPLLKERKPAACDTNSRTFKVKKSVHSGNVLHSPKLKPVHSGALLHSPKLLPVDSVTPLHNPKLKQAEGAKLLHSPKLSLDIKPESDEHSHNNMIHDKSKEKSQSDQPAHVHSSQTEQKVPTADQQKSNAVLISPPRKPKASVSEMQKALMRAHTDVAGEVYFHGKRKRGRPPGSKNRKSRLFDHRARSNSASSSCKSQFSTYKVTLESSPPVAEKLFPPISRTAENDTASYQVTGGDLALPTPTTTTATIFQSQKLSSSVQNRAKSLHSRKSKTLTSPKSNNSVPTELMLPLSTDQWVCSFCQQISNCGDMGDLFGGYSVLPHTPVFAKLLLNRKPFDTRHQDKVCRPPNEIWFHERCITWSSGVYMVAGKLYGVYEALTAAMQTVSWLSIS